MKRTCSALPARIILTHLFAIAIVFTATPPASAQPAGATLQLAEAVQIAVSARDPSIAGFESRAAALDQRAIADAQLPDPMARLAVANLPVDSFNFTQEPMTQLQLGLRQEFPRGDTLNINGVRRHAQADEQRARKDLALRRIELAVTTAWLDRFYFDKAKGIVAERRSAVTNLIEALSASFATGNLTSQDILRTELEISLLDDRLIEMERNEAVARVDLGRYIGADAERPLPGELPDLPEPAGFEAIADVLNRHPQLASYDALIEVEEADVRLAEQAYRPSWALEAGYGMRGGGRADFASLGISVSIPLFPGRRQDRNLEAAIAERGAARLDRGATALDLRRELERAYADWTHLKSRVELYRSATIARAGEAAEASITTYGNRLTDYPELIRSQLAELDAELKFFELATAQAKSWAVLKFLAGDAL